MLISKQITLKPLLESSQGVHLTAYLVNRGHISDLKAQLQDSINQAYEYLSPVMSTEERNKFLQPLDKLLKGSRIFKQIKGNIGIFRNQDSFRLVNIPVPVESMCQVATSFHVKPLLRWLQMDKEFLLLGLEKGAAHLYLGSQDSFKLVDSIIYPKSYFSNDHDDDYVSLKELRQRKIKEDQAFSWINNWISQLTKNTQPKLFIAGEEQQVESLYRILTYKNVASSPIANFYGKQNVSDVCAAIRKTLKAESKELIEKTLSEFRFAEAGSRTRKNIFQISRAVFQGRVRKLIVSDELNIFGKIDKKSGGLAIHPFDLDHEDDDILDDLAQMVLSQGGEVVVASKSDIPKGRPILAILDHEAEDLPKTESPFQYEEPQERVG